LQRSRRGPSIGAEFGKPESALWLYPSLVLSRLYDHPLPEAVATNTSPPMIVHVLSNWIRSHLMPTPRVDRSGCGIKKISQQQGTNSRANAY